MVLPACALIEAREDEPAPLEELGRGVGASPATCSGRLRGHGHHPAPVRGGAAVESVQGEGREGRDMTEALYESGYGSSSRPYYRRSRYSGALLLTFKGLRE